jgi:hypothetical protein
VLHPSRLACLLLLATAAAGCGRPVWFDLDDVAPPVTGPESATVAPVAIDERAATAVDDPTRIAWLDAFCAAAPPAPSPYDIPSDRAVLDRLAAEIAVAADAVPSPAGLDRELASVREIRRMLDDARAQGVAGRNDSPLALNAIAALDGLLQPTWVIRGTAPACVARDRGRLEVAIADRVDAARRSMTVEDRATVLIDPDWQAVGLALDDKTMAVTPVGDGRVAVSDVRSQIAVCVTITDGTPSFTGGRCDG